MKKLQPERKRKLVLSHETLRNLVGGEGDPYPVCGSCRPGSSSAMHEKRVTLFLSLAAAVLSLLLGAQAPARAVNIHIVEDPLSAPAGCGTPQAHVQGWMSSVQCGYSVIFGWTPGTYPECDVLVSTGADTSQGLVWTAYTAGLPTKCSCQYVANHIPACSSTPPDCPPSSYDNPPPQGGMFTLQKAAASALEPILLLERGTASFVAQRADAAHSRQWPSVDAFAGWLAQQLGGTAKRSPEGGFTITTERGEFYLRTERYHADAYIHGDRNSPTLWWRTSGAMPWSGDPEAIREALAGHGFALVDYLPPDSTPD
jgi:hypothetical protein